MGVFCNHLQRASWKIFPWEGKSGLRAQASTKIIWNKKNMTLRFSSGRNLTVYQSLGWNIQYSGIVKHFFGCVFHVTAIWCPLLSWYKELPKFNSGLGDCPDVIQRRLCGNQREANHRNTHWQKTDTSGSNAMKTVGNWRTPDCCRFVGPQVNNNRWRYSKMLRENILAARSNSSFLLFFYFYDIWKRLPFIYRNHDSPRPVQSQNFPRHFLNKPPKFLCLFLWSKYLPFLKSLQKWRDAGEVNNRAALFHEVNEVLGSWQSRILPQVRKSFISPRPPRCVGGLLAFSTTVMPNQEVQGADPGELKVLYGSPPEWGFYGNEKSQVGKTRSHPLPRLPCRRLSIYNWTFQSLRWEPACGWDGWKGRKEYNVPGSGTQIGIPEASLKWPHSSSSELSRRIRSRAGFYLALKHESPATLSAGPKETMLNS